ncbi:MAG: hypothetical protein JST89_20185 [Cyanobacteria bacterium SZAS-4]|nr:hypothetical protein [Cyanobacteria bacterium SZAS-4]
MESKLLERKSSTARSEQRASISDDRQRVSQAKSDLESLERSYRSSSRTLQSMVFGLIAAVMVLMAYSLFGGRVDREMFTTDVTPVHIELNPISNRKQTAQNPQNMQM